VTLIWQSFLSRTAVTLTLAWFVSCTKPHSSIPCICDTMRSSSGGCHYSSSHIGPMMLGMRTTVLLTRFHLTTVHWHFASEQYPWHITQSFPRVFFLFVQSLWVRYWEQWWCHFYARWKFCSGGWGLCFSNTARNLSKHLVAWTSLKPIILPRVYFSRRLIDRFCLLQKMITQSLPGVFFFLLNLSSIPFLSVNTKANPFSPQNLASESLQ